MSRRTYEQGGNGQKQLQVQERHQGDSVATRPSTLPLYDCAWACVEQGAPGHGHSRGEAV